MQSCLRKFLTGVKNPLGMHLRAMQSNSLKEEFFFEQRLANEI